MQKNNLLLLNFSWLRTIAYMLLSFISYSSSGQPAPPTDLCSPDNTSIIINFVQNVETNCEPCIDPSPLLVDVTVDCDLDGDENIFNAGASPFELEISDPVLISGNANCPGAVYAVNYTVNAECGSECATQYWTIQNEGPEIECPMDLYLNCGDEINDAYIEYWLSLTTATSECPLTLNGVQNNYSPGGFFTDGTCATGYKTVDFFASDDCGRSASCSANLFIFDYEKPEIIKPAEDQLVVCSYNTPADFQYWLDTHGGAVIEDACSGVTWTTIPVSPQLPLACDEVEVTFVATDNCSNSISTTAIFSLIDCHPPIITGQPMDLNIECAEDVDLALQEWLNSNGGATAIDACGEVYWMTDPMNPTLSDDCGNTGSVTVVFIAKDDCGNQALTDPATFAVVDTQAPTFTFVPADATVECSADLDDLEEAEAEDNCGSVSIEKDTEVTYVVSGNLSGDQEVPPSGSDGTGTVSGSINSTTGELNLEVTFSGLSAPTLFAHIHDGAAGNNGPVVIALPIEEGVTEGSFTFNTVFGAAELADLTVGNYYVNIHTEAVPSGELRAQLNVVQCGGQIVCTWTATDECGNTSTASSTTAIEDTESPVFTFVPADATVECSADLDDLEEAEAEDNCGSVSIEKDTEVTYVVSGNLSGDQEVPPSGSDGTGTVSGSINITTGELNLEVTFAGLSAPTLFAHIHDGEAGNNGPVVIALPIEEGVTEGSFIFNNVFGAAELADLTAGNYYVNIHTEAVPSGELRAQLNVVQCGGQIVCTWTATDECGNTSTASSTTAIEDTESPVFTFVPADATVECSADLDDLEEAEAEDNCGSVSIEKDTEVTYVVSGDLSGDQEVPPSGSDGTGTVSGSINITTGELNLEVTFAGLSAPTLFAHIHDGAAGANGPVVIALPIEVGVTEGSFTFNTVFGAAELADLTAGNYYVNIHTEAVPSGELRAQLNVVQCGGQIVCTWTATDECGNTSTASSTTAIEDTESPVFTFVPADEEVECIEDIPEPGVAEAIDNCGDVSISSSEEVMLSVMGSLSGSQEVPPSGSDASGMISGFIDTTNGTLTIDVTFSGLMDSTLFAHIHEAPAGSNGPVIFPLPIEVDVTEGAFTFTTDMEADQQATLTEGNYYVNIHTQAVPSGEIRAQLMVKECTGQVLRTYVATDDCGNSTLSTQTIIFNDNTPPEVPAAPGDMTVECPDDVPAPVDLTAVDNCDGAITVSPVSKVVPEMPTCANQYDVVRIWTFVDQCGNESSVTQVISVVDDTPPVFTFVPADLTVECPGDMAMPEEATAVDNCNGMVTITFEDEVNGTGCGMQMTRTWTATDECGNSATAMSTVTISDTEAPVFTYVPPVLDIDCALPPFDTETPIAEDNCGVVSFTFEDLPPNGDVCDQGASYTRRYTATDACGNSSTADVIVWVNADQGAPVFTFVPVDLTFYCETPFEIPTAVAEDDCDSEVTVTFEDVIIGTTVNCGNGFGYDIERTWMATDFCGNTTTAVTLAWVKPGSGPTIQAYNNDFNSGTNPNTDRSLSSAEAAVPKGLELNPNPVDERLNVSFLASTDQITTIRIFNILGKEIYRVEETAAKGMNTLIIPTQHLITGTYLLTLESESGVNTKKFIKQ